MKNLPPHLENQFFRVLNKEISIQDFEKWVYETEELEHVLSSDNYLDLIAFNFKQPHVLYELYKVLIEWINIQKYETYKIIYLLDLIICKDESWKKAVYLLGGQYRNNDYYFLNNFFLIDDYIEYYDTEKSADSIEHLFIASIKEAIKIKDELNLGKIVIKNQHKFEELEQKYFDYRLEEEK